MIEILKVVLFGIIEGITEWLPISSTGHLIILEEYINVTSIFKGGKQFWDFFLVVIQLGAILAVIVCYYDKLMIFSNNKEQRNNSIKMWSKIIVACLPAAIMGLLLDDFLEEKLYNYVTVSLMLILYGFIFIVVEMINKKRKIRINSITQMSYKIAFFIGIFQVLSLIPGTSRSGVTILGAMILFCSRDVACEFSFFLAIPIMVGATLLKMVKYFLNNQIIITDLFLLGIGIIVSFLVSIVIIKWLLKYVKSKDFKIFGFYRIVLGIVLILIKVL